MLPTSWRSHQPLSKGLRKLTFLGQLFGESPRSMSLRSINAGEHLNGPSQPMTMASLATLPVDILEQIAILSSSPSLADLLHLMMTCRRLYHSLSVASNPHVYANIARQLFEIPFTEQGVPPDSAVAAELIQRLRLLRRIRRGDQSIQTLSEDLWTAYGLVLEGGATNASHLSRAGFNGYIEDVVRKFSSSEVQDQGDREAQVECRNLAIWLFSLTITRDRINHMSEEAREGLLDLLRPLVLAKDIFELSQFHGVEHVFTSSVSTCSSLVTFYAQEQIPHPRCPPIISAVVTSCFALRQAYVPQVPSHLPVDRAAALAAQRLGPTRQDFQVMASFRTPIFADSITSPLDGQRTTAATYSKCSGQHQDPCLRKLRLSKVPNLSVHGYIQECLPGVWEGVLLVSPLMQSTQESESSNSDNNPDFWAQKPIQCALSTHFVFSPTLPVTWGHMDGDPLHWDVNPQAICQHSYEEDDSKHVTHEMLQRDAHISARSPDQALDCIIYGQTLSDHDEAWGAYNFYGRVRRDGLITLKRVPKYSWDVQSGSEIFEGYLCYGRSLVGTWRTCAAPEILSFNGVFSLGKRESPVKKK